jgi:hypothetical protein
VRKGGRDVKLNAYLHLVLRYRIVELYLDSPHTSSWTGIELSTWGNFNFYRIIYVPTNFKEMILTWVKQN